MNVGGCAMHWDGACPRFSPRFRQRSIYGVGTDLQLDYEELEPYYFDFENESELLERSDRRNTTHVLPRIRVPFPCLSNLKIRKRWEKTLAYHFDTTTGKATTTEHGRAV